MLERTWVYDGGWLNFLLLQFELFFSFLYLDGLIPCLRWIPVLLLLSKSCLGFINYVFLIELYFLSVLLVVT